MFISNAYAQAAAGPATGGLFGGGIAGFLPIIVMFVVFYFLMIRPQMKRQKEQRSMMQNLSKGNEVVTNGGILGRIARVTETHLVLEIGVDTEIIIQKSAVVTLLPNGTIKAI